MNYQGTHRELCFINGEPDFPYGYLDDVDGDIEFEKSRYS